MRTSSYLYWENKTCKLKVHVSFKWLIFCHQHKSLTVECKLTVNWVVDCKKFLIPTIEKRAGKIHVHTHVSRGGMILPIRSSHVDISSYLGLLLVYLASTNKHSPLVICLCPYAFCVLNACVCVWIHHVSCVSYVSSSFLPWVLSLLSFLVPRWSFPTPQRRRKINIVIKCVYYALESTRGMRFRLWPRHQWKPWQCRRISVYQPLFYFHHANSRKGRGGKEKTSSFPPQSPHLFRLMETTCRPNYWKSVD